MPHRYNLRSRETKYNEINNNKISIFIKPSWSFGISNYNSKNTFISIDKDENDKQYSYKFDSLTTLDTIYKKLLNEIIIKPKGILKDNLKFSFVNTKFKKPDNYEIKEDISLIKDFPTKNFIEFFNENSLHKTLETYIKDGENSLILYYHLNGTFVTENMCVVS